MRLKATISKRHSGYFRTWRSLVCGLSGLMLLAVGSGSTALIDSASANVTRESTDYLDDAESLLEKGDTRAAVIQLKNAIRADRNNVQARLALAKIYIAHQEGAAAEKELRAAIERGLPRKEVLVLLAQALALNNQVDRLLEEINPEEAEGADAALLHSFRARAYLSQKKQKEAEQEIAKAFAVDPAFPPALVTRSLLRQTAGDLPGAEEDIERALAAKPDLVEAHVQKGEIKRLRADFPGAVAAFSRALELQPQNTTALLGRAATKLALNKPAEAKADIDAILERHPEHPLAHYLQAVLLGRDGKYDEALATLQKARGLGDEYAPALYLSGSLNFMAGNLERARNAAARYVSQAPDVYAGRILLAAILLRQAEPQKAIEQLEPFVTPTSKDLSGIGLLATAYEMADQRSKAAELYSRAIEIDPKNVNLRMMLARTHLGGGDLEQASRQLERVASEAQNPTAANTLLIVTQVSEGKLEEAEKTALKFRESSPDRAIAHYLVASVALRRKDVSTARTSMEEALRIDPGFHPAALGLAALDRQAGKSADATKRLEKFLEKEPANTAVMLALAQIALADDRSDAALQWLDKASAADPKAEQPLALKANMLLAQNKNDQALVAVRELQGLAPDSPIALDTLGRVQLAMGENISAIGTYRRLVSVASTNAEAHYRLGQLLMQAGNFSEARQSFEAAANIAPDHLETQRARAEAVRRLDGIEPARALAASLSETIGADEALTLQGDLLFAEGQYAESVKLYRQLHEKQPSSRLAIRLSDGLARVRQDDEAIAVLKAWLSRQPDDAAARFALTNGYIRSGRYKDAIGESERILKSNADHGPTLNNLAWLYGQEGDIEKALLHARRAHEELPARPEVADTLGWLLLRRGEKEAAMPLLRQAWEEAPQNPEIGFHYASALAEDGQKQQAAQVLKDALKFVNAFPERQEAEALARRLGAQ